MRKTVLLSLLVVGCGDASVTRPHEHVVREVRRTVQDGEGTHAIHLRNGRLTHTLNGRLLAVVYRGTAEIYDARGEITATVRREAVSVRGTSIRGLAVRLLLPRAAQAQEGCRKELAAVTATAGAVALAGLKFLTSTNPADKTVNAFTLAVATTAYAFAGAAYVECMAEGGVQPEVA